MLPTGLSGSPLILGELGDRSAVALSVKLSDICWDSVQNVNIDGRQIEVVTDDGAFAFNFADVEDVRSPFDPCT